MFAIHCWTVASGVRQSLLHFCPSAHQIEITGIILGVKDDKGPGFLVDKIVDKTGAKGTGEREALAPRSAAHPPRHRHSHCTTRDLNDACSSRVGPWMVCVPLPSLVYDCREVDRTAGS